MGLLAEISVDGRFVVGDLAAGLQEQVQVQVTVSGPSWVEATNVVLFANGLKIREVAIPGSARGASGRESGEKAAVSWTIPRPGHDVHLVAISTGPGVTAPFGRSETLSTHVD
jgi:hypothetical protein